MSNTGNTAENFTEYDLKEIILSDIIPILNMERLSLKDIKVKKPGEITENNIYKSLIDTVDFMYSLGKNQVYEIELGGQNLVIRDIKNDQEAIKEITKPFIDKDISILAFGLFTDYPRFVPWFLAHPESNSSFSFVPGIGFNTQIVGQKIFVISKKIEYIYSIFAKAAAHIRGHKRKIKSYSSLTVSLFVFFAQDNNGVTSWYCTMLGSFQNTSVKQIKNSCLFLKTMNLSEYNGQYKNILNNLMATLISKAGSFCS
jgi:hypothetical protein